MNEENFKAMAETSSIKYRAVSKGSSHDWKGKWRHHYFQAEEDAERYWQRTGREVWIESEVKSRALFKKE